MAGTLSPKRARTAGQLVATLHAWPPMSDHVDFPPTRLRMELQEGRWLGARFDDAWATALPRALAVIESERERIAWEVALASTRNAWQRAYDGEDPCRWSRSLRAVGEAL